MSKYRIGVDHIKALCSECGECWEWGGSCSKSGVPKINIWVGRGKSGRTVLSARRVVWELTKGGITKGKLITTSCGNPKCLNPDHLKMTDAAQVARKNGARLDTKLRRSATLLVLRRKRSKLNEAQAAEIRESGQSVRTLAQVYGIGLSTVHRIRNGTTWQPAAAPNPFAQLILRAA